MAQDSPGREQPAIDEAKKNLVALLSGEQDLIANSANFVALLATMLDNINWVGLYFLREQELVLGPFQGRPACVRIALGRGVCGTALAELRTLRVADVHDFPGHIACDARSRSELVVPLQRDGSAWGVLDIDSPEPARFSAADQVFVEALVAVFCAHQLDTP